MKRVVGYVNTAEFKRVKELIAGMLPLDSFAIKKEWTNWPKKIVKDGNLPIVIRVGKIAGNEKVRRVYRLS